MTAMFVTEGKMLTPKERLYIRIFVRLVEKAINEYKKARECIISQVNAYSADSGHLFRAKAATLRSEATLGIFFVP